MDEADAWKLLVEQIKGIGEFGQETRRIADAHRFMLQDLLAEIAREKSDPIKFVENFAAAKIKSFEDALELLSQEPEPTTREDQFRKKLNIEGLSAAKLEYETITDRALIHLKRE